MLKPAHTIPVYVLTISGSVSEVTVQTDVGRNIILHPATHLFAPENHRKTWFYSRDEAYQFAINQQYKKAGALQQQMEQVTRLIDQLYNEQLQAPPPPSVEVDADDEPENPNCYCHEIPGGSATDPILCSYCEAEI